jgi:rRNA processing protein Gar1
MFEPKQFFKQGLHNTVEFQPGVNLTSSGPFTNVNGNTEIDRWHLGDFIGAEYTIVADFDYNAKEIIKCIITAAVPGNASVVIYARSNVGASLLDVIANVNDSYVSVQVTPKVSDSGLVYNGTSVFHNCTYFKNNHPVVQRQDESDIETAAGLVNTFDSNAVTMDSDTVRFDRG